MSVAIALHRLPGPRQARVLDVLAQNPAGLAAAALLALAGEPPLGFDGLRKMEAAGLIAIEPKRNLRQLAGALVRLRPDGIALAGAEPDVEV